MVLYVSRKLGKKTKMSVSKPSRW